jgi:hypothetical protein
LIALLAFVASCLDDRHSDHGTFFLAYGTVEKAPGQDIFIVLDDNDTTLHVSESAVPLDFFRDKMRLIIDYSIVEKATPGQDYHYSARVNQAKEIPTVEVNASGNNLGADPITVENYWLARGFLTFKYRISGTTPGHAVNLVLLPRVVGNDEENDEGKDEAIVYLELQHDAFNDPDDETLTDIISFPLYKAFPDAVEPLKLRISYNDPGKKEGNTTLEITYYPPKEL